MGYYSYYGKRQKNKRKKLFALAAVFSAVLLGGYFLFNQSAATLTPQIYTIQVPQQPQYDAPDIVWPGYGQAAVGAKGYGVLDSFNSASPQPIASTAKVMTALAVLEKYPLQPGETGPNIKITERDEEFFGNHLEVGGAALHLKAGSEISEYHALQLMLIKSYNNVADTLATWAFGSIDEYTNFANQKATALGMKHAHFSDASGLSPETAATAEDLVILGDFALKNQVIAEIVATWQTEVPGIGQITNSNQFLDFEDNGVVGIKTGDTEEAGGTYLVAAQREVDGLPVTLIGAVLGAPNHFKGQQDSMPMLDSAQNGFHKQTLVKQGQVVGKLYSKSGESINLISQENVVFLSWVNRNIQPNVALDKKLTGGAKSGTRVGSIVVSTVSDQQYFPVVTDVN